MNARPPLTSMFLPGCNMYNQNRVATSENTLAPTFLMHTRSAVPRPGTFKGWAATTGLRQQDDQSRASLRLRSFWYFGLPVMSFVTAAA